MKEVGLESMETEEGTKKMYETLKKLEDYSVEPKEMFAFTRDYLRIDVGMIVQRPPIFALMRERDIKYMKHRTEIMNEYFMDMKKHIKDLEEISTLNEDILANNPYASVMNLDNYPTHS